MSETRPISQLRNLGPACESDLNAVGVHTLDDIKELGIEKTFELMMLGRISRGESGYCFNASYLYALYGAVHDIDWRDVPESLKSEYKALTAKLRSEHQ